MQWFCVSLAYAPSDHAMGRHWLRSVPAAAGLQSLKTCCKEVMASHDLETAIHEEPLGTFIDSSGRHRVTPVHLPLGFRGTSAGLKRRCLTKEFMRMWLRVPRLPWRSFAPVMGRAQRLERRLRQSLRPCYNRRRGEGACRECRMRARCASCSQPSLKIHLQGQSQTILPP